MSETRKKLTGMAMCLRAAAGYHFIKVSDDDSLDLLREYYEILPVVWGKPEKICKKMSFRRFTRQARMSEIQLTFRGMHMEWFCGDTTEVHV